MTTQTDGGTDPDDAGGGTPQLRRCGSWSSGGRRRHVDRHPPAATRRTGRDHGGGAFGTRLVRQLRTPLLRRRDHRGGGRPPAADPAAAARALPSRCTGRHRGRRHRRRSTHGHGPVDRRREDVLSRVRQTRAESRCGPRSAPIPGRPRALVAHGRGRPAGWSTTWPPARRRRWSSAVASSDSRRPRTFAHAGIGVTVVEAAAQVPDPLDPELAVLVAAELVAHGVGVVTGAAVTAVHRRHRRTWRTGARFPRSWWSARSASDPTPGWPTWPDSGSDAMAGSPSTAPA